MPMLREIFDEPALGPGIVGDTLLVPASAAAFGNPNHDAKGRFAEAGESWQKIQVDTAGHPKLTTEAAQKMLHGVLDRPWGDETVQNATRWQYKLHRDWGDGRYVYHVVPKDEGRLETRNAGTVLERQVHAYDVPSGATEIDERPGHAYRGMSWEEWQNTLASGKLQSVGNHNIGQDGLTFYGNAATAEEYANSFAPMAFKPTADKPGVVVEIPQSVVKTHADDKRIPGGEFAHQGPADAALITRAWKLPASEVRPGMLEVVTGYGKPKEGSRSSPSVKHVVIPMANHELPRPVQPRAELSLAEFAASQPLLAGDMEEYVRERLAPHADGYPGLSIINGIYASEVVYRNAAGRPMGTVTFGVGGITGVAVSPRCRRRGVATAMLDYLERACGITEFVGEFSAAGAALAHQRAVKRALENDEGVSPFALQQYPDLAARFAAAKVKIPAGAIKVRNFPDLRQQKNWTCGDIAMEAVCRAFNVGGTGKGEDGQATEDWFVKKMKSTPQNGTHPDYMVALAKKLGLDPVVKHPMTDAQLRSALDDGKPVICCVQAWGKESEYVNDDSGHYVVAIGYDDAHVYFEDPSIARTRGYMLWEQFDARWHDKETEEEKYHRWGLVLSAPEEKAEAILSADADFGVIDKVIGVAKKVDSAIGDKLESMGGGDECEWITIHGPQGTTHICIGGSGHIVKGPKGMVGQHHDDALGKDHAEAKAATERVSMRQQKREATEKRATSKVREAADALDDIIGVLAGGSIPMAVAAATTKFYGQRIGAVRKATTKAKDALVERYGTAGAAAIVVSGLALSTVAGSALGRFGNALSFIPGNPMLWSLPIIGAVEAVRGAACAVKELCSQANRLAGAAQKLAGGKATLSVYEVAEDLAVAFDEAGKSKPWPDIDNIETLGKQFMAELAKAVADDLDVHQHEIDALKAMWQNVKS